MTHDTWLQLRESLRRRIGKDNFSTWIEPLRLSDLKNGVARFAVPTSFFGDWVSRNFADHIRGQLAVSGSPVDRVEFTVGAASERVPVAKPAAKAAKPARARLNGADLRGAQLGPLMIAADRLLPADLTGTCLRGADLSGADLKRAVLVGADLSRAKLFGACLRESDLTDAVTSGAHGLETGDAGA